MTRSSDSPQSLLVGRYVDGELSDSDRRAFEGRLATEPELQREVDELRALRGWFVDDAAARPVPSAGFRQRVLTETMRRAVQDSEQAGEDAKVVRWSRRVLYAAAAVLVLGLLAATGVLRPTDGDQLIAEPAEVERAMAELDARIEASRGDGR